MFDACASWWTQGVGHGNAEMAKAAAYAAGRYGHVMFPENAHAPATRLSQRLLQVVGRAQLHVALIGQVVSLPVSDSLRKGSPLNDNSSQLHETALSSSDFR